MPKAQLGLWTIESVSSNPKLTEDGPQHPRGDLLLVVARDRGAAASGRVEPEFMPGSLVFEHGADPAETAVQLGIGHGTTTASSTWILLASAP